MPKSWKLEDCVSHFGPTCKSREGSCLELSCQRSEGIMSITSLLPVNQCCLLCSHFFSPCQSTWRYMWMQYNHFQNFHHCCSLGHPSLTALSFDPTFTPFDRMYVAILSCHVSYTHYCQTCNRNITIRF
jgi:hypothetical protein